MWLRLMRLILKNIPWFVQGRLKILYLFLKYDNK